MRQENSPEEKLLRLIRKKSHPSSSGETTKASFGISNWISKQKNAVKETSSKQGEQSTFIRVLNGALILLCFFFTGYLIVYNVRSFRAERDEGRSSSHDANLVVESRSPQDIQSVEQKPFEYYAEQIIRRDLFRTAKPPAVQSTVVDPALTSNLKVVGIILDESPQVVIEDLKTNQTMFLKKGDQLRGAIVEEIQESKIILLYEGQRMELGQ